MSLPSRARFVVIGAGIHGLSTAYHLAKQLQAAGTGRGDDIVVLDKDGVGAGASGIACGVIRNNYFQPAMRRLMAHSVGVWETHSETLSYHPVGYMQLAPEVMRRQVATIAEQQREIGYESSLIEGAVDCQRYMEGIFHDWQAKNITCVLHEKRGGYANNMASLTGLASMAGAEGVRVLTGARVTGVRRDTTGAVTHVETDQGSIQCEQVIVGAGPWVRDFWSMLDLPSTVTIVGRDGNGYQRPMWVYWCLEEGTLRVDPSYLVDNDGNMPPVVHVDTDAPLFDDLTGDLITDSLWGNYFKPDFNFGGVQGGAMPYIVDRPLDEVAVDPYGVASPDFIVGDDFKRMWASSLAHCLKRFEGKSHLMSPEPSGGLGCFTPDSFPVFDRFCENVWVIADSNHGYKMIGVGDLVAKSIVAGETHELLHPFRFSRYAEGDLHPVSNSPFPWS
jgi:glycine/D-amino acid oxidase-like deaminating enzyme